MGQNWGLSNTDEEQLPGALHSAMATATLSALERSRDLDTGQVILIRAQDALDAVAPGAEPAWQVQVRHCEATCGQ